MKLFAFISVLWIGLLVTDAALINYDTALNAAILSEGTDAAIEEAMSSYGFCVDACDPVEPSMCDKYTALFVRICN